MTNFTINNTKYMANEKGYCYAVQNGKKVRVSKEVFDEALEQYISEKAEEEEVKETKKEIKKATRKSKNAVFKATITVADDKIADVTLTQKQLDFLTNLPNDDSFEHGADSTLWTDAYCDTLAHVMNAMVVGAIISTLREKDLIYIGQGKVNGKKCKYFGFTDLGKAILKELGLV